MNTATTDTLAAYRRITVKIGSALLVDAKTGELRRDWLRALADDVAGLKAEGRDVIIVSSGAISLGRRVLKLNAISLPLEQSQAAASAVRGVSRDRARLSCAHCA